MDCEPAYGALFAHFSAMATAHGKAARELLAAGPAVADANDGGSSGDQLRRTDIESTDLLECLVVAELYGPLLAPAAAELRDEVAVEARRAASWCAAVTSGDDVEAMAAALRGTRALGEFLGEERCAHVLLLLLDNCTILTDGDKYVLLLLDALSAECVRLHRSALESRRMALVMSATAALDSALSSEVSDVEIVDHALAKYAKYAADCGEHIARASGLGLHTMRADHWRCLQAGS